MTWKNILKIEMEEARRLGRKYAPKEMLQDDEKRKDIKLKSKILHFKHLIDWLKNNRNQNDLLPQTEVATMQEFYIDKLLPNRRPQIKDNMKIQEIVQIAEKIISEIEE